MAMPKLTLTTGTAPVEGSAIGTYLINLDQAAPVGGLTINFNTLGSTATMNTDYHFALGAGITAVTSNSFTIAEGASTAVLNLVAHADAILDSNETVILNLTSGAGYQLAATSTSLFAPAVDYAAGSYSSSVATGDFNGDGKLDMVLTNVHDNTVSVLLGTGSGTFATKVDYATGTTPGSVTTGDFNGDGKLDMATANADANTVSVLLGTGSGTFADKVDYAVGHYPRSVTTGDFNGDGKLDMAVANTYDVEVTH